MTILQNLFVSSYEGAVMDTGSGNDDLVRRVFMKWLWQASRFDRYTGGEVNQPYTRVGKRHTESFGYILRKLQPPMFNQLGDLPARDDAHSDAVNGTAVKHFALLFR